MLYEFLPKAIADVVNLLNSDKLNELRLRDGHPITVKYDFKQYYLSKAGLSFDMGQALTATDNDIKYVLEIVTERSMYAHNERLKQGFLSYKNGIRVGVAGECVGDNYVITIKNVKSIMIRFPCKTTELSANFKKIIHDDKKINNTLIISPPGYGKTTLIKRIIKYLSSFKNVLVIDERGELFDENVNADYIRYSDKEYGFSKGVRVLAPEIVVTDELITDSDIKTCERAIKSGLNIIATMHGNSVDKELFAKNIFNKYIVLNNQLKPSEIKCVYDRHNHITYE